MNVNLPPAPAAYDAGYFTRSLAMIDRLLGQAVLRFEAAPAVLLQSPNGSVYKVTVSDAGTLTTTAVPLGQQGSPPY